MGALFCASMAPTGRFHEIQPSYKCVRAFPLLSHPGSIFRMRSALAVTQATKHIILYFDAGPDPIDAMGSWIWKNLAYALFSKHSRLSITHVKLQEIDISEENVRAMEQVMHQDDPFPLLFPRHRLSGADNRRARLRQRTRVVFERVEPNEEIRDGSLAWVLDSNIDYVQVLSESSPGNDEDIVTVIIPENGLCKVSQDNLHPSQLQTNGRDEQCTCITSLHLSSRTTPICLADFLDCCSWWDRR